MRPTTSRRNASSADHADLEIINERFARMLRLGLFNFVRRTAKFRWGPCAS